MTSHLSLAGAAQDLPTHVLDEIVVTNPATGAVLGTVPVHGAVDVARAVERARGAQQSWAHVDVARRAKVIRACRKALLRRADELAAVVVAESGKPIDEVMLHEVAVTALHAAWTSSRGPRALRPVKLAPFVPGLPRTAERTFHPRGVVAVISPWNFPITIAAGTIFPALLAGNGVVWKPSELTPLCALKLLEILVDAGVPQGLVEVVTGFGATGRALLEADVDFVAFTGSTETGKKVGALCGERLIPCVLELGGKAPAIVLEDAPIERTARALVYGGFLNTGQACVSVERVFVDARIHDQLLARVLELTQKLRQGDPASGDVELGAMTMARQVEVVQRLVEDARAKGAVIHAVGAPAHGRFLPPTIIEGATPAMDVMHHESFGPVLPIMKVQDVEEAIRLANDHALGLNAYVFGGDAARCDEVAARVRAGTVVVNDVLANYAMAEAPFHGVKHSGLGAVHGEEGLRALCEERVIVRTRFVSLAREPWWHPYDGRAVKAMRAGLDRALDVVERLDRWRG